MKYLILFQAVQGFIVNILRSSKEDDEVKSLIVETKDYEKEAQMLTKESHQDLLSKCQNKYKESAEKIDSYSRSIAIFKTKIVIGKGRTRNQFTRKYINS